MSGTLIPDAIRSPARLFTAADLARFPTSLPSGDIDYELDRGRLIVMVPPGRPHGRAQSKIIIELGLQGERAGHGEVITETGVILSRNPDSVVGPDAMFVGAAKLPSRESREGYLETIPDLVVEVRSKNDTQPEIDAKVAAYLAAGVRFVWTADPEARTITVHQSGAEPRIYRNSDTLTSDDPIPGLRINVADIFRT